MDEKSTLGGRIRRLRVSKGISQEELGKVLDKSHAAISDIELGKTDLSVSDLSKIAGFFKVAVSELLQESQTAFTQYRDSKNITPEEQKMADKVAQDFIKYARELANKNEE